MPATKFDKPIFPGAKLVSATVTVTNTSGSYSNTFLDERIATSMKADRIEVGDPSIFNDKISITTGDGSFTIACNSVAGSTSVTVSFLKIADDQTEVTSAEFDILNNRIGDLSSLSTTAKTNAVAAINENKQAITSNTQAIANLNNRIATGVINSGTLTANGDTSIPISFGKTFPSIPKIITSVYPNVSTTPTWFVKYIGSLTTSGCNINIRNNGEAVTLSDARNISWIAIV